LIAPEYCRDSVTKDVAAVSPEQVDSAVGQGLIRGVCPPRTCLPGGGDCMGQRCSGRGGLATQMPGGAPGRRCLGHGRLPGLQCLRCRPVDDLAVAAEHGAVARAIPGQVGKNGGGESVIRTGDLLYGSAGAVIAGAMTVITNVPNPAGYSILRRDIRRSVDERFGDLAVRPLSRDF
jgi:hypothetical protein